MLPLEIKPLILEENVELLKGGTECVASSPSKGDASKRESQKLLYKTRCLRSGFIIEATEPEEVGMDRQTEREQKPLVSRF